MGHLDFLERLRERLDELERDLEDDEERLGLRARRPGSPFLTRRTRDMSTADGFVVPCNGPSCMTNFCMSLESCRKAVSALESMAFCATNCAMLSD